MRFALGVLLATLGTQRYGIEQVITTTTIRDPPGIGDARVTVVLTPAEVPASLGGARLIVANNTPVLECDIANRGNDPIARVELTLLEQDGAGSRIGLERLELPPDQLPIESQTTRRVRVPVITLPLADGHTFRVGLSALATPINQWTTLSVEPESISAAVRPTALVLASDTSPVEVVNADVASSDRGVPVTVRMLIRNTVNEPLSIVQVDVFLFANGILRRSYPIRMSLTAMGTEARTLSILGSSLPTDVKESTTWNVLVGVSRAEGVSRMWRNDRLTNEARGRARRAE